MNQYVKSNPKGLKNIKHIVTLMLENRSFDSLLGWLYDEKSPPNNQNFGGLNSQLWNPLNNIDSDGVPFVEKVGVEKNGVKEDKYGEKISYPANYALPSPDPGEGFRDTNYQLYGYYDVAQAYPPEALNQGFVNNYQNAMLYGAYSFGDQPTNPRDIMRCYTPEQTNVLSTLAQQFSVSDQYYCSVPSQTLPNRSFVHAATSGGNVNNSPNPFCDGRTIYDQIEEEIKKGRSELSWGIFGNNPMPTSGSKRKKDAQGKFGKDYFSLTRLCMTSLHGPEFDKNFHSLDHFFALSTSGELPSYSFLEPNFGGPNQNDQHPPQDIRHAEKLIAEVYNAIKNSPAFESTLLIVTYDEHGGCYDHVSPPKGAKNPDASNPAGQDGFLFNRFGVRVPCVLISPYVKKGLIARADGYTPYDHTSIIRTVQNCFDLTGTLTERDKAAPDLSGVLEDSPRKNDFPDITAPDCALASDPNHINDLHRECARMTELLSGIPSTEEEHPLRFTQNIFDRVFIKRSLNSK
ncbi:MAG: alkaline phosphatase family protein [Cyclobacteriaceae bacterium]